MPLFIQITAFKFHTCFCKQIVKNCKILTFMNLTVYVWSTRFRQFEKRGKLYDRIVHVFNYSSVNDREAFKGPTSCSLIFKQCQYMYLENKKMDRHILFGHGTYTCTLYMCYMCINVINIFWFETCIYMTTMKIIRATQ